MDKQEFAVAITRWLVGLGVALAASMTVVGCARFWHGGEGAKEMTKTFSMLIQQGSIIRLAAIFAIIYSTFILCVIDALKAEIAASIFSAIAGFVLGGATNRLSTSPDPQEKPS